MACSASREAEAGRVSASRAGGHAPRTGERVARKSAASRACFCVTWDLSSFRFSARILLCPNSAFAPKQGASQAWIACIWRRWPHLRPMTSLLGNTATARFELPSTDSPWQVAFGAPSKLGRCLSPRTFLAFRVLLALFWTGITIWSMVDHKANDLETAPEFYIYLTNWSLLIEWFYLVSATFVTRMALRKPKRTALDGAPSKTPLFARITYAAQVETYVLSFFVFVLYWALVYDGGTIHALSVFTHGVNFLVALADCLVAGIPMRLVQFWLPFVISSTCVRVE